MSKYQWPASHLGEQEMELLFQTKQKTQMTICKLLRRAVHIAYGDNINKSSIRSKAKERIKNER